MPYVGSPFWSEVLDEIAAVTGGTGRSLHVYSSHAGESGESIIAQLATSPDNEAIVLLGYSNSATEDLYCRLVERGYRVVTVDSPIRGLPAPFVGVDNDMGIYMGVRHLVELGHRRITLLSYEPPQNVNTQLRANAFLSAAAENDLLEARVFRVDLSVPGGRCVAVAMESIWSDPQSRPTALFCDSAGGAVSALKWCVEQGIAIPKELSILSFDNTRQVQFSRPTMSCIAQPLRQIAHVVMELVERPQIRHILLPPTLVVRNSTASLH